MHHFLQVQFTNPEIDQLLFLGARTIFQEDIFVQEHYIYNNAHQDNVFKPRQSSRHCETGPLLLPQSIEEKITKVTNIQDYLVEKMDPIMK